MAVAHKHTLPTSAPQPLHCDSEPVRTLAVEITMAVAHRDMLQTSVPQPLQCDSEPVRTLAAQITMAVAHNHNGSQPLLEALDTAPATRKAASGTTGDNARHSPFWRLWTLRLPRGRQAAAPAATTRATAPSGGSGYHEDSQRRQRALQPLLALGTAPATRTASGTSGDNARRSPFWRLWVLRLPRGRQAAAPPATTRATAPSGGSGHCACHAEDRQRHHQRQRAPQPLLEALGTAPATRTASGTSGDNARCSPFWRLWVLRLPRRQPAAPAATTRAAAPSGGSGYCACHDLLLYSGIFVFFCCF